MGKLLIAAPGRGNGGGSYGNGLPVTKHLILYNNIFL